MRRSTWRPTALLLVAAATAAAAQQPTPHQLRSDIRVLIAFQALGFTQAQAQVILTAAREIRVQNEAVKQAQDAFYLETHAAVVAIEWAMIRNETVERDQQETIDSARVRYRRATDGTERAIAAAQKTIDGALSEAQAALIEPNEAAAERAEKVEQARRALAEASRLATSDLTMWMPNTDDETIAAQVGERVDAVLAAGYPGATAEQLAVLRPKLMQLYGQVGAMSPTQFSQFREQIGPRLRAVLVPLAQADRGRFLLSRQEWTDLWRGTDGPRLLAEMLPVLPAGDNR